MQVYAIAAYVEGEAARREFGIRNRGGFFTGDSGVGEYCDAALDGSCSKLLVLQLLRDVSGETFVSVCFFTPDSYQPVQCLHIRIVVYASLVCEMFTALLVLTHAGTMLATGWGPW